jgi:hypothetical protein
MQSRTVYGRLLKVLAILASVALSPAANGSETEAEKLVREAFDYYRGEASYAVMEMTIHRPEWERGQVLRGWTRGDKDGTIIITEPARDRGNGTLKRGEQMWTFNPRVNRVIKLPPSLMGQSWMGSDFTNHDLSKTDSIVIDYDSELISKETVNGQVISHIKLIPKPEAPVVWGSQMLLIRDDHILLEQQFFDQDGELVKSLVASELDMLGGRLLPRVLTMVQAEDDRKYTRIRYDEMEFLDGLPDRYFTEAFLRNPRE